MNRFYKHITSFGILTVLYLLEMYENDESYEICNDIVLAIEKANENFGTNFPTKINGTIAEMVKEDHETFGLNPENISMTKYIFYAQDIYNQLQA